MATTLSRLQAQKTSPSLTGRSISASNSSSFLKATPGALLIAAVASCAPTMAQSIPGLSSDGTMVTVTAPGGLQTPALSVNGSGAGSIVLQQGLSQGGAPVGSIQITAPTSVSSAYTLTLPPNGPDSTHPFLAFSSQGVGYFTALPTATVTAAPTSGATLGSNTFNAPQMVNGGNSSLPLVITSSNANGASIAIDNSSAGGIYTLMYSNSSKNAGLWDYTHFRDTLTCSQTTGAVSCGSTHVVSTSGQPTIAANTGAGTGAFAGFSTDQNNAPSDQSGVITITTGSSPAAGSVIATINFNQAWLRTTASQVEATDYAPACAIGPANAAAASLTGPSTAYASIASRSSFTINSNSQPLAANTSYVWTYKCM